VYGKRLELVVGCFMLAGIVAFLVLAFQVSGFTTYFPGKTYQLKAVFDNIGDLKSRAAVSIAGVKVGKVSQIQLEPDSYRATVTLTLNKLVQHLPLSTSASIFTEGLLGSNYVSLNPGIEFDEKEFLKSGDTIDTTYSALILEDLIGKFLFNTEKKEEKKS